MNVPKLWVCSMGQTETQQDVIKYVSASSIDIVAQPIVAEAIDRLKARIAELEHPHNGDR